MARQVPERTLEQQRDAEKRAALLAADVAQVRAWAAKWDVTLFDVPDESLLRSIHTARLEEPGIPAAARAESRRYLKTQA